jgi:hypothetical protein
MNVIIDNTSEPLRSGDCAQGAAQDRAAEGTGLVIAAHLPANWAWSAVNSQYDWMDAHAPFAVLD